MLLWPERRRMAAGLALALLSTVSGIALLVVSGHFITEMALVGAGGAAVNYYTPAALIRLLAILRTGGRYGERLSTHDATLAMLGRLRVWLFGRLIPLAPARLGGLRSAQLHDRLRADVDTLEHAYLGLLVPFAVAACSALGVVALACLYSMPLGAALGVLLLTAGGALPATVRRQAAGASARVQAHTQALRWQLADALQGRAELVLFGAQARFDHRLEHTLEQREVEQRRLYRVGAWGEAGTLLLVQLALIAALLVGLPLLRAGSLQAPDLVLLVMLAIAGFEAMAPLPAAWAQLDAVRAAAQRVFALADTPPAVLDPVQPTPLPQGNALCLRSVQLRHGDDAAWALDGVDLDLPEGTHLALVGVSGAGKSSLAGALGGLLPIKGSITLGGAPLEHLRGDDLRRRIAVVEQRPYLFDASLRDNLLLAAPATDAQRLDEVIDQAQLRDYVQGLPQGLDTWVGENGAAVSGGEARRIAVARALLTEAPVLVLDEPTEGLDAQTAAALYRALASATRGRTVLLITHRLAGLGELVDEVATLAGGRVVARTPVAAYLRHLAARAGVAPTRRGVSEGTSKRLPA